MNLSEYSLLDGTALAELVRSGEVQPGEIAELALRAIELLNPRLNAVIESYPERTRAIHATGSDDAPLRGVPMLLKDTGATEQGKPQTCGSRIGVGHIAAGDTYLTQRYRAAGLNILGRTTLPEFAQAATTESALFGATGNPWDPSLSSGGSSGGAAAAVAAGMVPIAHGTDTGGSIRIPAACCSLVGLKPSRGRISKGPLVDENLYGGLNTEHVITRTVRDTAAVLDCSNGPGRGDAFALLPPTTAFTSALARPPPPLRIALTWETHTGMPVDPEVANAARHVALQLEALGHHVSEAAPEIEGEAYAVADSIVWAYSTEREVRRLAAATGKPMDVEHLERPTLEALEFARGLTLDDWFGAMATYNRICRTVGTFFCDYDLLLTPTVASVAPPLGVLNSNRDIGWQEFMAVTANFCPHTALFNVTGQPAISLPLCVSAGGLPIGIQLVARQGEEATLLALAAVLEQAIPWRLKIPAIHASHHQD